MIDYRQLVTLTEIWVPGYSAETETLHEKLTTSTNVTIKLNIRNIINITNKLCAAHIRLAILSVKIVFVRLYHYYEHNKEKMFQFLKFKSPFLFLLLKYVDVDAQDFVRLLL